MKHTKARECSSRICGDREARHVQRRRKGSRVDLRGDLGLVVLAAEPGDSMHQGELNVQCAVVDHKVVRLARSGWCLFSESSRLCDRRRVRSGTPTAMGSVLTSRA